MRELLYQAYLRYPRAFYDRHATGQVLSRATNDLYPIRYFIGWGLVQGMQSIMMIIGVGIVLVIVDAQLALYTVVSLPPITWLTLRFARRVSPISRQVQERKGDVTEAADEAVVGIEMVQAFGREDDVRERFGEKAEGVRSTVLRQAGVESRHLPGLYYLPGPVDRRRRLLRWPRVHPRQPHDRPLLPLRDAPPAARLAARGARLDHEPRAARARLGRPELRLARRDRAAARARAAAPPAAPPQPLDVRFEKVGFAYGGEVDVLHDLDLVIAPGEIVAVCGSTGSGKTSLLNLLPRFYDPTAGRVLVGGVDTRDLPIAELRADVALVTQRPVLFSVPLRENLTRRTRGRGLGARRSPRAEAAGVDSFGPTLPEGYETLIGERGVNLSGGQRQRTALARALATGARVVVLDDPLSAVDTFTERRLVEAPPPRARRPHRPRRDAASLDGRARRPRRRPHGRPDRRVGQAGRPAPRRRPVRAALRRRGGRVRRLTKYLEGRKLVAALMILVGAGNAAAQSGGWLHHPERDQQRDRRRATSTT